MNELRLEMDRYQVYVEYWMRISSALLTMVYWKIVRSSVKHAVWLYSNLAGWYKSRHIWITKIIICPSLVVMYSLYYLQQLFCYLQ